MQRRRWMSRRLPDLRAALRRPRADLPRLGRDLAEARGRDRGARRAPARAQRERAPRRLRAGAGGRRGLRRRAQAGRRLRRCRAARRRSSRRTSPRRSTSSPTRGAARTSARRRGADHPDGAPREHRALAGAVPRARRGAALPGGRRARRALAGCSWTRSSRAATCSWWRSRTCRTCSARSTRSRRSSRASRAAGAMSLVDGAQAVPHMPVDVDGDRRRLLRAGPGTRRSGRRGSACCTAGASCSSRWSRS